MLFERLYDLREEKELSRLQVSQAINVHPRTYCYYERGERMIPPQMLAALALFHGTSVDYLMGLTDIFEPYERKHNR